MEGAGETEIDFRAKKNVSLLAQCLLRWVSHGVPTYSWYSKDH